MTAPGISTAAPIPDAGAPAIELAGATIGYDGLDVVHAIDLAVEPGEMVVLLGPSGSGKTTILAAVAGFLPVRTGEIRIGGRVVARPDRSEPPERRDVAVVFQGAALWPHLSSRDTVGYPLRRRGLTSDRARDEADRILDGLGLAALGDRRPAELSGGEQQRVGLGRALARGASVHLFDEPTAHLDGALRDRLVDEIDANRRAAGAAGLYATHDTAEALAIADRLVLVRDGRVVQTGDPVSVYERPVDIWAARLTGPASEVEAIVLGRDGDRTRVEIGGVEATVRLDALDGRDPAEPGTARLLVRPDWAELGGPFAGRVLAVRYQGSHTDLVLATGGGPATIRRLGRVDARIGEPLGWSLWRALRLTPRQLEEVRPPSIDRSA
jgi:ABC-type Fe3+/spermidine/putrescine transport system ATPase subunit